MEAVVGVAEAVQLSGPLLQGARRNVEFISCLGCSAARRPWRRGALPSRGPVSVVRWPAVQRRVTIVRRRRTCTCLWCRAASGTREFNQLLAKRLPERMPGIDPDDAEFAREELQFLQRKGEALVLGMAVDVGIELRGGEFAVDHVAFQFRHVDAVGGETAERLVERGGQVAHPENKSGDQWSRALFGPVR